MITLHVLFNCTEWLLLGHNRMTGTLATELGLLSNLDLLSFERSKLTGTLPSEIGLLTELKEINLFRCRTLEGTIPDELYTGSEYLNALILGGNQFSGTLSTLIGNLSRLSYLILRGNRNLVGTVPTELGLLKELETLHIDWTELSGSIPAEVCALRGSEDRFLSKVSADCLPRSSDNVTVPMFCPEGCCTLCCDQDSDYCERY